MGEGLDQVAQALALGRCLVGIAQQPQRQDQIAVEDDGRIMAEAVSMALVLGQIVEGLALLPERPRFLQPAQGKQGAAHSSAGLQQHRGLLGCLGDREDLFPELHPRLDIS